MPQKKLKNTFIKMTNWEEINNELLEIAPNLAKLKKRESYRSPEGYFESLESEVKQSLGSKEYSVPEGYFENLRLDVEEQVPEKKKTNIRLLMPYLAAAASFILIAFLWMGTDVTQVNILDEDLSFEDYTLDMDILDELTSEEIAMMDEGEFDLSLIDNNDLDAYLAHIIDDLDENELFELMDN